MDDQVPKSSTSSLFSKDMGALRRRTEAELFSDETMRGETKPPTPPRDVPLVMKKEPIIAPAVKSKKDRWRQALQAPSLEPLVHASSPLNEEKKIFPSLIISQPFSLNVDEGIEKFDDISPSKGAVGCRPNFIPSFVEEKESIVNSSPMVESESEKPIPPTTVVPQEAGVDHLVLVIHGINGSEDYLYQNLEKMKESFEQIRSYWFSKTTKSSLFHLELINWKSEVIGMQSSIFEKITPRGSLPPESRMFINYAISDVAFYLTPSHCEVIKEIVINLLNERVGELRIKFPIKFQYSKITLVGYSLGSVIVHDILTSSSSSSDINSLCFEPYKLFFWGSPLAAYLAVKDREFMIGKFVLPRRIQDVFNIYHPHDPVAFRIEPLFYHLDSELADAETVPFWKTDGMLTWGTVKNLFSSDTSDEAASRPLVPKRRLDFVLQESVTESISHHYSMLTAHYSYWSSRDVALFMLRRMTGLEPSRN